MPLILYASGTPRVISLSSYAVPKNPFALLAEPTFSNLALRRVLSLLTGSVIVRVYVTFNTAPLSAESNPDNVNDCPEPDDVAVPV